MTANFALLGIGGFVAPRHLKAISDNGGTLVAACDPFDSVGVMDRYFPDAAFFTEVERFDRFLEKRRRESAAAAVKYVSVCSPNYLHDAHCRLALRLGAHAICEKPLVINPWNLDALDTIGRGVRVELGAESFEGVATGVERSGTLIVSTDSGTRHVTTGDVIHLRVTNP